VIHRLGIDFVPVDESSNGCCAMWNRWPIECIPNSALGLRGAYPQGCSLALILASSSAIRRQMLRAAGVEHNSIAPAVDEDSIKAAHSDAADMTMELAAAKALSISRASLDAWVIGSDSAVTVAGRLFNKPSSREAAAEHLRTFSGGAMQLTSAVAFARGGEVDWRHVETATLKVRPLSEEFIATYLDAEWPEVGYCVGVFRMEGRGVQLFDSVEGDYFTILGMPLIPLLGALRERGMLIA
jgi:septum formation protein